MEPWSHGAALQNDGIASSTLQTLNFISHRGLGWAGTGIKSSSQEQLLKAGYKSLRGERCGHFPSA